MHNKNPSRRDFLRRICSLGVMGTVSYLHSPMSIASADSQARHNLAKQIEGKVFHRDDENYEIWRQSMVWHISKPNRFPDLIVQARTEQDVIEAVNYARNNKLKLSMRSSGHNSAGSALRNGGVLLDLSFLREINVDPVKRIATSQPGLWCTQLLSETGKHNLAFPASHCPSVALGGYLLGGGMGWNHAHWGGMACHSVRSMEIITADGNKVTASPTTNKELYWAARGAGPGFFGVVMQYELDLYRAPQAIFGSMYIHTLDNLAVVTESLEQLVRIKDERVEILMLFMHNHQAPPGTPPEQAKICFVGMNAFADSEAEARSMLSPFANSPLATKSVFKMEYQPTTFNKLYNPENVDTGRGRYAVDNDWTNDFSAALHASADHFRRSPSPRSHLLASLAIKPELRDDASFSSIANHYIANYLVWDEEKDDEANHAWLKTANEILRPHSEGHYVNEVAGDRYPQRFTDSFSKPNWQRLQSLRKQYDPEGVFHTYLGH